MLQYEVTLPIKPEPNDIASQKLTVSHGEVVEEMVLAKEDLVANILVPDEVDVTLSLVYVDDSGNVSEARTQMFHSHDSIAPDAPGEFGAITLTGEVL